MSSDIVLSATLRKNINVINSTVKAFELTSARLASGKKVNTALDNPQNFSAALELNNRAADFNRRLDAIGQSLSTVQKADIGVEAIKQLIDQGEAIVIESLEKALVNEVDTALIDVEFDDSPPSLRTQILEAGPDAYFPLDGATAENLSTSTGIGRANADNTGGNINTIAVGSFEGGVNTGQPPLYSNGGTGSADFNGVDGRVDIADNRLINTSAQPQRTIELVFNADDIMTRQTLYEEGGPTNGFNMYVFNGRAHVTGTDQGDWGRNSPTGPNNINAPIEVGETYHLTLRFDQPSDRFEGFLNGVSMGFVPVDNAIFPSHSNDIAIGRTRNDAHFDDILVNGNGNNFNGRISDVAIYNRALTDGEILDHATSLEATTFTRKANKDYDVILNQIDQIVSDSAYRSTNLLDDDDLITDFNPNRSASLTTEGVNFTSAGLGLDRFEFDTAENIEIILEQLRAARAEVREFGTNLANDLAVLQTREDFTLSLINNHNAGADKLVLADQNEEGAKQLANSTRLQLATTALSLGSQQAAGIVNLISQSIRG